MTEQRDQPIETEHGVHPQIFESWVQDRRRARGGDKKTPILSRS